MRVLFIQGVSRYGGALKSLFITMELLSKEGIIPILVTSREGRLTEDCKKANIKYYTFPIGMWRKVKSWPFLPITIYRLVKIAKKENIDIIHCNTLWDTPYGILIGFITGKPVIAHIRGTHTRDLIKKYFIKLPNKILSVSFSCLRYFDSTEIAKSRVIYNPQEGFPTITKTDKEKRAFTISIIGRIDPYKGQLEFIDKVYKKIEKLINIKVFIVGGASKKDKNIEEKIEQESKKSKGKIIKTGETSNVYEYYTIGDIIAIPSKPELMEGFPRVCIESAIAKRFVIATKSGGTEEIVNKKTGILVKNLEEMVSPIIKSLLYPKIRLTYGINLSKKGLRLCSEKAFLESLLKTYREVGEKGLRGGII